jgi:cytochrome c biogenesis protein CcdA/thiol-disulfide isomerase/thioredoxin
MLLLLGFALVAGAGTALSPCALPVLPALLSAGAAGGRRRPLGVVAGLSATFCVTIVGLAEVAGGVGVGDGTLRTVAIAALLIFGVAVAVPALGARLEAPLSRLARLGPRTRGDGFVSGLGVGAALGFVYAPCAGPILAAVVSVSAVSGRIVAVALAYTLGAAAVLLALALGGRRLADRVRRAGRGPALQTVLGVVMVLTAVALLARLDIRLQTALAQHLGDGGVAGFLADPAGALERSNAVSRRLEDLRGGPRFAHRSGLPVLGEAPELTGTQRWFNSAPLTVTGLRGRVVLIDFWTYTCVNCIRTQPYLKAWDERYRSRGLTIVGVHSPEFGFEKDAGNVGRAVRAAGLRYPVVQDNDLATWRAWGNQYWPAEYLVDAAGRVRRAHFGEGDYAATERAIRSLLAEAGARRLGGRARPQGAVTPTATTTPETYLGTLRAERLVHGVAPRRLRPSRFELLGRWRRGLEQATAGPGARLAARVRARAVYLVLGSPGRTPRRVRILLDGHPVPAVTVREQRLYTIAFLRRPGDHLLELRLDPGLSAYAFTFG